MKISAAVFCILFFAACALAQKESPLPKDLPAYGPQAALYSPDVQVSKLANGLTVWMVPRPGLPKVSFVVEVRGGLAADPQMRPGLAELLAATLDQGTKARSAKQIAEGLQAAGGDLTTDARRDSIFVSTSVLSSKTDSALSLLADVLENASFPDGEVDLAKRNLSDSLSEREAQPSFQANRALARILFEGNPYSVIAPTLASIVNTKTSELRQEYARRFRPDQAVLVTVGDFEPGQMKVLLQEKLGGWTAPQGQPVGATPKPSGNPAHAVYIMPRPDSVQTTLALAAFGPLQGDADYEAADVANAIYGGTFSSRLVSNIREDKGYTYSPGSRLQTLRDACVVRTQADVRNAVTGASLNEIFYEMNRLATTSPTGEELSKAKQFMLGFEAVQLQSRDELAAKLSDLWVNDLPPAEIGAYGRKVQVVNAEDVDAAARKYFLASRMVIVAVGEDKVIREQLAPFGLPMQPLR